MKNTDIWSLRCLLSFSLSARMRLLYKTSLPVQVCIYTSSLPEIFSLSHRSKSDSVGCFQKAVWKQLSDRWVNFSTLTGRAWKDLFYTQLSKNALCSHLEGAFHKGKRVDGEASGPPTQLAQSKGLWDRPRRVRKRRCKRESVKKYAPA